MKCSALLTIFAVCVAADAFVPRSRPAMMRGGGLPMSATAEDEKTKGKKAGDDAPPASLGWDTHKAVVRDIE